MPFQLLSFAVGLAAFVFYTGVFLILVRIRLKIGWLGLQISAGLIIHVFSTILAHYLLRGFIYWYALGLFSVCWFCFFTLSTAVYVSISVRILLIINEQPGQFLPVEDIFNICIRKPFEERAEFLVNSELVQKGKIGFRLTNKGDKTARRLLLMRRLLGMEGSGLYTLKKKLINEIGRKK